MGAPQLHSAQKQEAGPTLKPWASLTQAPEAQGSSMAFPPLRMPQKLCPNHRREEPQD